MARKEFSDKTKELAFKRANGCCEICGFPFAGERPDYDHILSCEEGGDNSVDNCAVIHSRCHKQKTKDHSRRRAKTKRVRRKTRGIRKPSRFPGAKNSRWKKKINGEVVER